jgi:hypothetical protein
LQSEVKCVGLAVKALYKIIEELKKSCNRFANQGSNKKKKKDKATADDISIVSPAITPEDEVKISSLEDKATKEFIKIQQRREKKIAAEKKREEDAMEKERQQKRKEEIAAKKAEGLAKKSSPGIDGVVGVNDNEKRRRDETGEVEEQGDNVEGSLSISGSMPMPGPPSSTTITTQAKKRVKVLGEKELKEQAVLVKQQGLMMSLFKGSGAGTTRSSLPATTATPSSSSSSSHVLSLSAPSGSKDAQREGGESGVHDDGIIWGEGEYKEGREMVNSLQLQPTSGDIDTDGGSSGAGVSFSGKVPLLTVEERKSGSLPAMGRVVFDDEAFEKAMASGLSYSEISADYRERYE